jgi:hypothetical protein
MSEFKDFIDFDAEIINIAAIIGEGLYSADQETIISEATTATKYSIEINFRSKIKEVLDNYAKIVLGYVSAALKQNGYHIKQVFEENPIRIIISSRNWDNGEWVGLVHWHPDHAGGSFMISKGFYNKEKRTASIQSTTKSNDDSAAEIAKEMRNIMNNLKGKPDRHISSLKPVSLKRGPKK